MARMIPSVLSPEIKSNAERKIFEWFRDDPETEGWVVLHSLGIANHRTVLYGELDFFVIAPRLGVFALEVKGGRVSCNEGVWSFTNKYGKTTSKTRGPFAQANEGMFSLIDAVKLKFGQRHRLSNLLFGTGVVFPDIEFQVDGTEGEQWQVFDMRDGMAVGSYIRRLSQNVKRKWEEQFGYFPEDKLPDAKDVKELASMLRGNFDKVMSIGKKIAYAEEALITLTEEQFRCLDQLEDNPRCLIRGAAGTGKTLLAIEEVKRSVALGQKVAFFCYNSMLANWLKLLFEDVVPEMQPAFIGTIHSWLLQVANSAGANIRPGIDELDEFYKKELPLLALDALDLCHVSYDKIVIDEAQDILGTDSFEVLDAVLKGGLERGKWAIFGDFTRQAIYQNADKVDDIIEKLDNRTSFIRFKLKINCRNTKFIGDEIKCITGFDSGAYIWSKIEGVPVEHKIFSSQDEQKQQLEDLICKLIADGISAENITILSPYKRENSVVADISNVKIKDYTPKTEGKVTFSTIQAYKGLENTVIIMTDIESFEHEQLMYVGLSRARSGLFILESNGARKEYLNIQKRRFLEDGYKA
ncbi:MAG: hypothetical protein IJW54_01880 [Clostridia bacterium]|nr:hypothetical protein [Clostridia bacterium]